MRLGGALAGEIALATRTPDTKPPSLRAVLDAAPRPLLLILADAPVYTMVLANDAHARAFRTTPGALEGRGVLDMLKSVRGPEAVAFATAIRRSFDLVLRERRSDEMSPGRIRVTRGDGTEADRYLSATNAPVLGPDGEVGYILSASQDVTGEVLEQRHDEARDLLLREIDHRARNTLAVTQSIVRLTTASNLEVFRENLARRIEALGRVQTSLVARRWEGATLNQILNDELDALDAKGRHVLDGPEILLRPEHAHPVGMALHELATNAAKYGALSTSDGLLEVNWSRAGAELDLTWRETGGPTARKPASEGFGSRLIARLERQMRGEIRQDWNPSGLVVSMRLRLDRA